MRSARVARFLELLSTLDDVEQNAIYDLLVHRMRCTIMAGSATPEEKT